MENPQDVGGLNFIAPSSIRTVLADGAYDGSSSRKLIKDRGAIALIPPPKNARIKGFDTNRDDAACIIRGLGGDSKARSLWGRCIGYRSKISCRKCLFKNEEIIWIKIRACHQLDQTRCFGSFPSIFPILFWPT